MNIIIFDTETIGKVSQDLLNVGYKIIDLNIQNGTYNTLCERDYVVTNLINNAIYCLNDDFVGAKKYNAYLGLLNDKKIIKRNLKAIFKTLTNDLKKHNVLFGYAYNCKFDLDKITKSGLDNPFENLPVFDIWDYAVKYICETEEYKKWALENNQLTATESYISTSVEGVARYLYDNLDFTEDHTALSDVQHETTILVECVKRGCDITRALPSNHFIKSEKLLQDIVIIDGNETIIKYKSKTKRNNKTYYKM